METCVDKNLKMKTTSFLILVMLLQKPLLADNFTPQNLQRKVLQVKVLNKVCSYSTQELDILPKETIKTKLLWRKDVVEFAGPTLSMVLASCSNGAVSNKSLRVEALDGYSIEIPHTDLVSYSPILAIRENGHLMPNNKEGPLWVIYPLDRFKLKTVTYLNRMVWQVKELESD